MNPGAPTQLFFMISLVALIGVLAALDIVTFIPVAAVWIVTIASIVFAGTRVIRGA
jgi:hypothetical protein